MKRTEALLAVALALSPAGCVLRKRQSAKAVPPPPKPASAPATPAPRQLSIPQTTVVLPPPQPVSPEALATDQEPTAPVETPPKPRPTRKQAGPIAPPKAEAPAAQPPAAAAPPPEERPAIGEIVPAEEQKRLQAAVQDDRRTVRQIVEQAQARGLSQQDQARVRRIQEFLKLSEEAQGGGNMRQAAELAHRGLILAKELQVGR